MSSAGSAPASAAAPRAPASESVTVSITRTVDPSRIAESSGWVKEGMDRAGTYPGFLGSGWVRASEDSANWHMLYRFSTPELLAVWEGSTERAEWLSAGHDLVLEARAEKRTGIEGWFDAPQEGPDNAPTFQPPRWKQAISIGLGFFPLNVAFSLLVTWLITGWNDLPTIPRILLTTLVMAPTMTYLVMPWITRMLRPWLLRRPKPRASATA